MPHTHRNELFNNIKDAIVACLYDFFTADGANGLGEAFDEMLFLQQDGELDVNDLIDELNMYEWSLPDGSDTEDILDAWVTTKARILREMQEDS